MAVLTGDARQQFENHEVQTEKKKVVSIHISVDEGQA